MRVGWQRYSCQMRANEDRLLKINIEHHTTILYQALSTVCWLLFKYLPSRLRTLAMFVIHSLQVSIYQFSRMNLGWKVHRLTKILSWDMTKWGLFLNIVPQAVCTLLSSVLQCLDPIGQKSHQQQIWSHMKFSANPRKCFFFCSLHINK